MREKALKKAALVQISVKNATTIHNYSQETKKSKNGGRRHANNHQNKGSNSKNSPEPQERRFTRSEFTKSMLGNNALRSQSVFDVPALMQVSNLFDLIDQSRRCIKDAMSSPTDSHVNPTHHNSSSSHYNSGSQDNSSGQHSSKMNQITSGSAIENPRFQILEESNQQIRNIMKSLKMRLWECLIPLYNYPLSESLVGKVTELEHSVLVIPRILLTTTPHTLHVLYYSHHMH